MIATTNRNSLQLTKRRVIHAGIGTLSLYLGAMFYASMRPVQAWIAWAPRLPRVALPDVLAGSLPCFLHVAAFALLGTAVSRRPRHTIALWTMIGLLWETLQGYFPSLGTFDPWDLIACLAGGAFSLLVATLLPLNGGAVKSRLWFKVPTLVLGAWALMATSKARGPYVRESFRVDPPRPVAIAGTIVSHGSYLFISEPDIGIHVYDNHDPEHPRAVAFLNVPGNRDLAAKDGSLYADSCADLLAIAVKDETFTLTHREESVFPDDCIEMSLAEADFASARFALLGDYLYTLGDKLSAQQETTPGAKKPILAVFDISMPAQPRLSGEVDVIDAPETLSIDGKKLYIGARGGVDIFDLSDPGRPLAQTTTTHFHPCEPVIADGNLAYLTLRADGECADGANQLTIYDIENPTAPVALGSLSMQAPSGLAVKSGTAYVCDGPAGLRILDVKTPAAIVDLPGVPEDLCRDVILRDKGLITTGNSGIGQYDVSTSPPRKLGTIEIGGAD